MVAKPKTIFQLEEKARFQLRIESHLIQVARAWCKGKNYVRISTLEEFYLQLMHEVDLYSRDTATRSDWVGLRLVDGNRIEISTRIALKDRPADSLSAVITVAP